ncbi:MAG: HDOD domain-containing protein [Burkholderiaceae bacterium]|nr:HDOD domain-containing protein [Burkholderiaceae bacterium]
MNTVFNSDAKKTIDLLWASVRARGDLPGFSKVINSIIGAMNGENDGEFNMTKTVLSDPALTQRVLRLANSAMYSVFGSGINTVSKAVTVLGTESIGHLALGLKLIDGLTNAAPDAPGTRSELEKAVLAGHIGRQVASSANTRDVEEVVVCSMLHTLGRTMVTFYLPQLWASVAQALDEGTSEDAAVQRILGLGLDEIGRAIARQWGFPASLVNSMAQVAPREVDEPIDHEQWLAAVSTVSSRCAEIICRDEVANTSELAQMISGYTSMLGLDAAQIMAAVDSALQIVEDEAVIAAPGKFAGTKKETEKEAEKQRSRGKPAESVQLLKRGVNDLREAMNTANARQLLTIALETVYQGLGFSRAIAFVRNSERHQYMVRLGFGEGMPALLDKLWFPDAYQPDVFHAALANDKMIFVENAHAPAFSSKLPRWWKGSLFDARSFMVLPLTINRNPMAFIYGDWDMNLPPAKIEAAEIVPLNELHSLLVSVIEQRRQRDQLSSRDIF